MCFSPAHFHQFLHPSIDSHYEGPAKSGMIVEIQGYPKHLLMPKLSGHSNQCTSDNNHFCGRTLYAHKNFFVGVLGVLGVICGRTGRTWAYKGVHGRNIAGALMYTTGRNEIQRCVFRFRTFNLNPSWILSQLSYERVLYIKSFV